MSSLVGKDVVVAVGEAVRVAVVLAEGMPTVVLLLELQGGRTWNAVAFAA